MRSHILKKPLLCPIRSFGLRPCWQGGKTRDDHDREQISVVVGVELIQTAKPRNIAESVKIKSPKYYYDDFICGICYDDCCILCSAFAVNNGGILHLLHSNTLLSPAKKPETALCRPAAELLRAFYVWA